LVFCFSPFIRFSFSFLPLCFLSLFLNLW
jgi:hypothetical protein